MISECGVPDDSYHVQHGGYLHGLQPIANHPDEGHTEISHAYNKKYGSNSGTWPTYI